MSFQEEIEEGIEIEGAEKVQINQMFASIVAKVDIGMFFFKIFLLFIVCLFKFYF